jgi:hypothetical protein
VPSRAAPVRVGLIYHIAMSVEGGGEIVVATTRPETMLGDAAIAVHSSDARYAPLVGRHVIHPLTEARIPVIVDDALVDPTKGTGAVKITPGELIWWMAARRRLCEPLCFLADPIVFALQNFALLAHLTSARHERPRGRDPCGPAC